MGPDSARGGWGRCVWAGWRQAVGRSGTGGGSGECGAQPAEAFGDLGGPPPGAVDAQAGAAGGAGELGGHMQHPVAERGDLAPGQRREWAWSMRSSNRHAVGIDATGPNSASRSRSTSIPVTASAPSAIATARSANTLPGHIHREPAVSIEQHPRHGGDQPRLLRQLTQQRRPGMRHHAPPVRADLDPRPPAATLHPRSAFLSGILDLQTAQFSLVLQSRFHRAFPLASDEWLPAPGLQLRGVTSSGWPAG
jgi:hypothetical protein